MIVRKRSINGTPVEKGRMNEKKLQNITIKNYEINSNGKKKYFFDYYGCIYPFNMPISLYKYPPIFGYCSLSDFQEIGAKRLALLQFLDTCTISGEEEKDTYNNLKGKMDKDALTNNYNDNKNKQIRQKIFEYKFGIQSMKNYSKEEMENIIMTDLLSHYILRIAFAKDKEKQQWFLKQELKLFIFRLNELKNINVLNSHNLGESERGLIHLLNRENLNYEFLSKPMISSFGVKDEAWEKYTSFIPNRDTIEKVFKIPFFPDAYFLVKDHKVCVDKAIAYVPDIYLDVILVTQFKITIKESFKYLDQNEKLLLNVQNDSRISSFLTALPKAYVAKDYRQNYEHTQETRLMPQNLYNVYKQSFPPCMRRIFVNFLKEKHLKHWARQQLWLFLKGAGMTLEENIHSNRSIWLQADKFDKEHRYTIRYMYGKEGKKTDFSPYNCSSIINNFPIPSSGDTHGCPFKNFDEAHLKSLLFFFGLTDGQIKNIMPFKMNNEYQMACVKFFMETHPGSSADGVGNHPNSYYIESRKYYKSKATNGTSEAGAQKASAS
ncbi:DNA primase large subunit, putative [Plasmodium knowlesi strain H]|uniref:DNA primase large subunit n=3 Tax=Plasmodium knowlesi TaxID=5850 RepID=A0A5K1V1G9_PLAKH|nr:DNA primase large subunit, putative [Plasmodium knowlesi strain H]OTN67292.1 DNA primase large subunit [Plasmodium knowlesi]CAA9987379.1 DNA primase large subunit, putative [Plasmodium knowlesi strain H]SBO23327.1 DNA primase large subunit, putative [Plasmodium knowlesi strain H]SBO24421.1 DNA primase large subunit, putative [Plasmodium knowlesi strain H]VVS76853.1 DNA primase large subunit, putative [Plasmodium knowlesi strain H]|eukprot:XP_002258382.1 dna primase, large subunit, putative [Plasmodium knowlesi strain H]